MARCLWIAICFVAWLPARGSAAFSTCTDAWIYGVNSSGLYVAQAFSRLECNEVLLPTYHSAVGRALSSMSLRGRDSDTEKLCFYGGLWEGITTRLSHEYAMCGSEGDFECVSRLELAAYAGSVLRALASGGLADPGAFDETAVQLVFETDSISLPGVSLCSERPSQSDCASAVREKGGGSASGRYNALIGDIAELVCSG